MVGASSRLLFPLTNPISIRHHRSFALFRLPRGSSLTQSAAPSHLVYLCRRNSLIPIKFAQNFYSRATNNAFHMNNHIAANDYHVSPSHPWPEWSRLLESLSIAGYFNADSNVEDEFVAKKNLSMEFVAAANSCLAFARDRPDILGWLPRKDIEVFIDDGYPFLFKSASETERRMRSFLQADGSNEARSVDLMKYILSYASNPAIYLERKIKEDTESSVRSLLQEMANLSYRGRASEQFQAVARDEQMPRNLGPNITMERGDWIRPNLLQEMANLSYRGRASEQFQAVARDGQMPRNLGPNITVKRDDWIRPNLLQEMANLSYKGRASEQFEAVARDEQMPRNLGPNITMKRDDWIRPNLLQEIANWGNRGRASKQFQAVARDEQMPRNLGPNITTERVDWMCPKCSFMNFARNTTCFKCKELRPQRQLTDGEWDCPQCNFFNYKRNAVCLKCGGTRPGEAPSPGQANTPSERQMIGSHYRNNYDDNGVPGGNKFRVATSVDCNLDQFHGNSIDRGQNDRNNARPSIAMRSHSGYVPFVPSPGSPGQANTPSEGQMIGSHYQNNYDDNGVPGGNKFRVATSVVHNLDQFHGNSIDRGQNDRNNGRPSIAMRSHSGYVPFVPSPGSPGQANTPSEGQMIGSHYQNNYDDNGVPGGNKFRVATSVDHNLDQFHGIDRCQKDINNGRPSIAMRSHSGNVPFVPLPADMFTKKREKATNEHSEEADESVKAGEYVQSRHTQDIDKEEKSERWFKKVKELADMFAKKPEKTTNEHSEEADELVKAGDYVQSRHTQDIDKEEKSERWFEKVKELHGVTGPTSAVLHDDFPQIMPVRKGENRFVDSKKIHQPFSLYPRQQAMEQGSTSSVVPFVPFPPDSFAKKDDQQQQPESTDLTVKPTDDISLSLSQENKNLVQGTRNQQMSGTDNLDSMSSIGTNTDSSNDQFRRNETRCDISNIGQQTPETPNVRSGWTEKSLEESAVTEADPLDMSEEAKAERWFRRTAYIKDISELSQIPDEDFPSIMPMRKGMNRFVVRKRKTPLERRLTSPQYRKNLRIMSSDPMKREGDDDNLTIEA